MSEEEHEAELDLLRAIESDLGLSDIVAPKAGPTNAPVAPPVVDPGPVAEPVPAAEQAPPPASPEVASAAPEETNAFSGTEPPPA